MIKYGLHLGKDDKKNIIENVKSYIGIINICQIYTQIPRKIGEVKFDRDILSNVLKEGKMDVYIHSSYLVNPWGDKPYNMEWAIKQMNDAYKLNSKGVIFHIPKLEPHDLVDKYKILLANSKGVNILLENRATRPDDNLTYEFPYKFNNLIEIFIHHNIPKKDIHLCIDTAHLFCGKQNISKYEDAKKWLTDFKYKECIKLIHLNGNATMSHKDIHAIAFSKNDYIWKNYTYNESGFKAFVELNKPIILECDLKTEKQEALSLFKTITKN